MLYFNVAFLFRCFLFLKNSLRLFPSFTDHRSSFPSSSISRRRRRCPGASYLGVAVLRSPLMSAAVEDGVRKTNASSSTPSSPPPSTPAARRSPGSLTGGGPWTSLLTTAAPQATPRPKDGGGSRSHGPGIIIVRHL